MHPFSNMLCIHILINHIQYRSNGMRGFAINLEEHPRSRSHFQLSAISCLDICWNNWHCIISLFLFHYIPFFFCFYRTSKFNIFFQRKSLFFFFKINCLLRMKLSSNNFSWKKILNCISKVYGDQRSERVNWWQTRLERKREIFL